MAAESVRIRAVLDPSAMLSYARGHIHVGELVVDIADEGAVVALPTVALVGAYTRAGDDEFITGRLRLLATLDGVAVQPLDLDDVVDVSSTAGSTRGDLARAHAVWIALDNDAYYLTTEPQEAPPVLADWQVHQIPEEDA